MQHPHRKSASGRQCRLLAAGVLCLAGLNTAQARDAGTADGWRFQVTPYVWMSGLDGEVRPFQGAPTAHVGKPFSELLDGLDAAAFVSGSARRDRFVVQADFSHAATSDSATLPMGLEARAKVRQTSASLTAGYNLTPTDAASVDLMAGLRHWDIDADVQVPGVGSARSGTSFVDPILAARWRQGVAARWSTLLHADAGGFGVGSKSTWQLLGSVNYQARDNVFLSLGYRHLSVDYRDRGRRLDFNLGGPVVGVTWLFGKQD